MQNFWLTIITQRSSVCGHAAVAGEALPLLNTNPLISTRILLTGSAGPCRNTVIMRIRERRHQSRVISTVLTMSYTFSYYCSHSWGPHKCSSQAYEPIKHIYDVNVCLLRLNKLCNQCITHSKVWLLVPVYSWHVLIVMTTAKIMMLHVMWKPHQSHL